MTTLNQHPRQNNYARPSVREEQGKGVRMLLSRLNAFLERPWITIDTDTFLRRGVPFVKALDHGYEAVRSIKEYRLVMPDNTDELKEVMEAKTNA